MTIWLLLYFLYFLHPIHCESEPPNTAPARTVWFLAVKIFSNITHLLLGYVLFWNSEDWNYCLIILLTVAPTRAAGPGLSCKLVCPAAGREKEGRNNKETKFCWERSMSVFSIAHTVHQARWMSRKYWRGLGSRRRNWKIWVLRTGSILSPLSIIWHYSLIIIYIIIITW